MESLFSFALYVENIYGLNKSCNIPAVGFRLLDYPTVVIHCNSSSKCKNVTEQDENNNIYNDNSLDDDDDSVFYFGKGKSCLFKNNIEELDKLLKEIPLYVMILDSNDQTSRLMGCCSIPLINLFNQMKKQIKVLGMDSPTAAEEVDMFMVYNLMGLKTGELKLQLKLNFYGTSLLKHKNKHGKDWSVDTYLELKNNELLNNCIKPDKLVDHSDELKLECKPLKEVEDKAVQCIEKNYEKLHNKKKKGKCNLEIFDEFHNTNVYCPPPLFLNLYEKTKDMSQKKPASSPLLSDSEQSQCLKSKLRSKYGSFDNISSIEEPYTEILQPVENRNSICIISDKRKKKTEEKNLDIKKNINELENVPPCENLPSHGNLIPNINLPPNSNQHLNIIDISKLPLLSALSAEIAKLTNVINKIEVPGGEPNVLDDNTMKQRLKKQIKNDYDMPIKIDASDPPEKPVVCQSIDSVINVNKNRSEKVLQVKNVKPNKNAKSQKGKLKFKSTRTQKLRYKLMKQSKQVKISEILQQSNDKDNCINDDQFHIVNQSNAKQMDDLNSLEVVTAQIGGWMKGLHTEETEKSRSDQLPEGNEDIIPHISTKANKDDPSTTVDSHDTPIVKTNPGFYSPATGSEILQPELGDIVGQNRYPSKLKKGHRSGSRGIESRGIESRNNESSMYAYDTFSSEDAQDCSKGYSSDTRSCSTISQTSSISLPFSIRDSEKSFPQISNASSKSLSRCSNASDKSDKSLRQHSNASNKSLRHRSHASDKSNKSLRKRSDSASNKSEKSSRPHSNITDESDKSLHQHSNASNKSAKSLSRHSNASYNSLHRGSNASNKSDKQLSQHSNASDKPDKYLQQSDAPEKSYHQQLDASDSIEGINSSRFSSVKLERYMGDNSSATSERHTLDMLDDSRPETQASVNTLPDDSIFSPKHLSNTPHSDKENVQDPNASCYSPIKDIPTVPVSPDEVNAIKPNSSIYSPRKTKHTASSFQLSKRTHGLGKLEERPASELSGDTTMREIDMLLGEDSQLTSGSSIVMTTDETISPAGSASIPRKYKHFNQTPHVHGLNKFDKRQVETVKEVEISADEEEHSSHSNKYTLRGDEAYDNPKKSDFSPHQSKQFVQKKTYENVFRETLPPFSSNTNESSVDSGF